jgi:DNA-binding CsgD family transcriptional regulator
LNDWLTRRELEICRYAHLSYDEIGEKLDISPRTVKAITDRIRLKLGVRNKRHIQDRCREMGIKLD